MTLGKSPHPFPPDSSLHTRTTCSPHYGTHWQNSRFEEHRRRQQKKARHDRVALPQLAWYANYKDGIRLRCTSGLAMILAVTMRRRALSATVLMNSRASAIAVEPPFSGCEQSKAKLRDRETFYLPTDLASSGRVNIYAAKMCVPPV